MKTAISVPDHVFHQVDKVASAHGMNRSQFFTAAAERYAEELESTAVTDAVNAALDASSTDGLTDMVTDVGIRYLAGDNDEW